MNITAHEKDSALYFFRENKEDREQDGLFAKVEEWKDNPCLVIKGSIRLDCIQMVLDEVKRLREDASIDSTSQLKRVSLAF
jgi:hypothetical protein